MDSSVLMKMLIIVCKTDRSWDTKIIQINQKFREQGSKDIAYDNDKKEGETWILLPLWHQIYGIVTIFPILYVHPVIQLAINKLSLQMKTRNTVDIFHPHIHRSLQGKGIFEKWTHLSWLLLTVYTEGVYLYACSCMFIYTVSMQKPKGNGEWEISPCLGVHGISKENTGMP